MTLDSILLLAMAVFALAIKPGAGMMMVMSRTLAQGIEACLTFVLGFCIVSLLFLGIVVFGYKFIESIDIVFISILIKSLSALYLIWLGVKGFQEAGEPVLMKDSKAKSFKENLTASLLLTLSNPLTIVFYAGILPTILDVQSIMISDVITISFVIIVVELVTAVGYVLPLLWYRTRITDHVFRKLKYLSAIVLILVGLYIGYTALPANDITSVF